MKEPRVSDAIKRCAAGEVALPSFQIPPNPHTIPNLRVASSEATTPNLLLYGLGKAQTLSGRRTRFIGSSKQSLQMNTGQSPRERSMQEWQIAEVRT